MKSQELPKRLWIVVKVESGIPTVVEAYRSRQSAEREERFLRENMHPENDETGVFEVLVEDL